MKTRIYGAIVVVLLVVYLLQGVLAGRDRNAVSLPAIPANLQHISVTTAEGEVTLTLDATTERWHVGPEQFPADTAVVERVLEPLQGEPRLGIVTERGNRDEFGLGGVARREIVLTGESTLTVTLGDAAAVGEFVYGQIDRRGPIVRIPRRVSAGLFGRAADYRDMVVFRVAEDELASIKIRDHHGAVLPEEVLLRRETEEWAIAGVEVNSQRVRDLLREVTALTVDRYHDQPRPVEEPLLTVELHRESGDPVILELAAPSANRRFAGVISTSEYTFDLPEWRVRRLFLGFDDAIDRLFAES